MVVYQAVNSGEWEHLPGIWTEPRARMKCIQLVRSGVAFRAVTVPHPDWIVEGLDITK